MLPIVMIIQQIDINLPVIVPQAQFLHFQLYCFKHRIQALDSLSLIHFENLLRVFGETRETEKGSAGSEDMHSVNVFAAYFQEHSIVVFAQSLPMNY